MKRVLSHNITSYDLLKTLAVLTMIVDHVGAYFFPEDFWWRAVGRLSVPMWMFLIGYARSRDISPRLIGGAVILSAANLVISPAVFPMTILWGIILVRRFIDPIAAYMFANKENMVLGFAAVVVLYIPLGFLFDYGSACFLLALMGFAVRHVGEARYPMIAGRVDVARFIVLVLGFHAAGSIFMFQLDLYQSVFVICGLLVSAPAFYSFRARAFEARWMPVSIKGALQFCGRRTLEIYVAHLLVFKGLGFLLGVPGLGLFVWKWI